MLVQLYTIGLEMNEKKNERKSFSCRIIRLYKVSYVVWRKVRHSRVFKFESALIF